MNKPVCTTLVFLALFVGLADAARAQETPTPPPSEPPAADPAPPAPPAPPAAPAAPAAEGSDGAAAGYDGGFFIAAEGNELSIGGRVQPRFVLESADVGDERTTESAFSIARARLSLAGTVFDEAIRFKFQADFGKGDVALKDFYVDYRLGGAPVIVRAGQFKRPFSRQQLTSSSKLEFIDRAITDKAFGNGRDIGLALHNGFSKSPPFEWVIGVFNGTGDAGEFEVDLDSGEVDRSNVPTKLRPAIVARAGVNQGGIKGYSEADLEGGPLRSAVGVSAMALLDNDGGDDAALRFGADYMVKAYGWSATGGLFVEAAQEGESFGDLGHAQIGFFTELGHVIAGRFQPALRYALVDPDGAEGEVHEVLGAFSIYSHGHNVKWQADAGVLVTDTPGGSTEDLRARMQLQLSF